VFPGAVNRMKSSSKKEMAFYLMLGCVVLSCLMIYKTANLWYLLAGLISGALAVWARWKHQEALEMEKQQPSEDYLRGVKDASAVQSRK